MSYSFEQHKMSGAIQADDEYWKGLLVGEFRLPRCSQCKGWTWPAHYRCGQCGSWEFEYVALEPVGRIFTYTTTRMPFDRVLERRDQVPYTTVVAEIPHAGNVRVMGILKGEEEGLAIGAAVRASFDPPSPVTKNYPSLRWELAK